MNAAHCEFETQGQDKLSLLQWVPVQFIPTSSCFVVCVVCVGMFFCVIVYTENAVACLHQE